jgi:hypothetical protein
MQETPSDPGAGEPSTGPSVSASIPRDENVRTIAGSTVWDDPDGAVGEGEEADDADADNTSGGDDESVYGSEEDYEEDEEDDEDDSTAQPHGRSAVYSSSVLLVCLRRIAACSAVVKPRAKPPKRPGPLNPLSPLSPLRSLGPEPAGMSGSITSTSCGVSELHPFV